MTLSSIVAEHRRLRYRLAKFLLGGQWHLPIEDGAYVLIADGRTKVLFKAKTLDLKLETDAPSYDAALYRPVTHAGSFSGTLGDDR